MTPSIGNSANGSCGSHSCRNPSRLYAKFGKYRFWRSFLAHCLRFHKGQSMRSTYPHIRVFRKNAPTQAGGFTYSRLPETHSDPSRRLYIFGSSRNTLRSKPEAFQQLAGGQRSATTGFEFPNEQYPGGMTDLSTQESLNNRPHQTC